MSAALFLLFESASGYSLFEVKEADEIGQSTNEVRRSVTQFERFSKLVRLVGFKPFESAADALEQVNSISESQMTDGLKAFLTINLPKVKSTKKAKFELGVGDPKLGSDILEKARIPCVCRDLTGELLRGIRIHFTKLLKQLKDADLNRAQLGLGHSYSRAKVKFNVNRADNMIIQAISLLDTLDRDINTFTMRIREWYSWHFPELAKLVTDSYQYVQTVMIIRDKAQINKEESQQAITDVVGIVHDKPSVGLSSEDGCVGSDEKADEVLTAAAMSMGQDISPIDLINIEHFASKVIKLADYRQKLMNYLIDKMHVVAPNLSALIGEVIGARLISQAGSLTNLAKYPSSTVQILGAEKALFRAMKERSNTPKYGIIYNCSYIGRAQKKNKGRISRYVASKSSVCSRIDAFMDARTDVFGKLLKQQCEDRLRFYEGGCRQSKNVDVMAEALKTIELTAEAEDDVVMGDVESEDETTEERRASKKKKKKQMSKEDSTSEMETPKKKKKRKSEAGESVEPVTKKKKKDKKDKAKSA